MKKRAALLMTGILMGLTACGNQQVAETPAEGNTEVSQENTEASGEAEGVEETSQETSGAEEGAVTEDGEQDGFVEDTVLSTDLFTLTIPDEYKGKFLARIDGNEIGIFDKESSEAGYGGFVFSVIADMDKEVVAGGMYTKVGELVTADGQVCDVCVSGPSDVQWDYTASDGMPENYAGLYNSSESFIEAIQGNNGSTYMHGAGKKGEDLYSMTVAQYVGALSEGWDASQFEEAGMSPEFYALTQSEGDKAYDKMGFAYRDISNDGVDELLVGIIGDGDEPSVVYDIYTMVDRIPTLVVSGTARNSYYGMEYGGVTNVFSGGAMENGLRVYTITPGTNELYLQYGIKYDGYTDESNPWYVNEGTGEDDDTWKQTTEEEYNMWNERAMEQCLKLDFTPFSKVMPVDYSKVDLSKYDTFTQMIADFKQGMAYANEKLGDTDVFFVASGTYNDEDNNANAIDAALFMYGEDKIVYLGQVASAGTAYPLSLKDGYLYTGSHHGVVKTTVKDGKLVTAEEATETFDTDGNATYYYGTDKDAAKTVEDDSELTRMFEEYENAQPIAFAVVSQ